MLAGGVALAQAAAGGTASPPPGRSGAGRGGEVERRFDEDGELYTRAEFVEEYGGTVEWDRARRPPPPSPPPRTLESASSQVVARRVAASIT